MLHPLLVCDLDRGYNMLIGLKKRARQSLAGPSPMKPFRFDPHGIVTHPSYEKVDWRE